MVAIMFIIIMILVMEVGWYEYKPMAMIKRMITIVNHSEYHDDNFDDINHDEDDDHNGNNLMSKPLTSNSLMLLNKRCS